MMAEEQLLFVVAVFQGDLVGNGEGVLFFMVVSGSEFSGELCLFFLKRLFTERCYDSCSPVIML